MDGTSAHSRRQSSPGLVRPPCHPDLVTPAEVDALWIPERVSEDTRDLTNERLLAAVHALRRIGEGNALAAAREWVDRFPATRTWTETVAAYGVDTDVFELACVAIRALNHHGLAADVIAAFGRHPAADGTVTIIAAAGLTRGQIADLVQQRTHPDLAALTTLLALRGYRLPSPAASGAPEARAAAVTSGARPDGS